MKMLRIQIDSSSLLGQVLFRVLPDSKIKISDKLEMEGPPDIYLMDLDHLADKHNLFNYDVYTPLIGLTFIHPEMAILDPRLVFFDCPSIYIVQKPFLLSCLCELISNSPRGFERVYGNPGINLFWHFWKYLSLTGSNTQIRALKYRIGNLFPGLLEKAGGDLTKCFEAMPVRILNSLYERLAHFGVDEGLEGRLGCLAGAANSYLPNDKKRQKNYFDNIETFFEATERQRKAFYFHTRDIKNLADITQRLKGLLSMKWDYEILLSIYSLHSETQKSLENLERTLANNLNAQVNSKEVAENAINTGKSLKKLLNLTDNLQKEGVNHEATPNRR
jgi:hypothetical protein